VVEYGPAIAEVVAAVVGYSPLTPALRARLVELRGLVALLRLAASANIKVRTPTPPPPHTLHTHTRYTRTTHTHTNTCTYTLKYTHAAKRI
jgi:hypothetical protein